MNKDFTSCYATVKRWALSAQSAQWLDAADIGLLNRLETESADDLFAAEKVRPLVVGFFGGTGAGKSSLLNRLAGETVATVGVKRPTSMRATLYLHHSQTITSLPKESPILETDTHYHSIPDKSHIAWLDMPDIDSVEQANRTLALAWLPYIDWLIYVTTPERYRDDVGWELIRQRQNKHHWLFVINHWDEAKASQLDEFCSDLKSAGFSDPKVLRTSCIAETEDDFAQLERIINQAIEEHGLAELQRVGILAKFEELDVIVSSFLSRIGSEEQWQRVQTDIARKIAQRLRLFKDRLSTEIEAVVQHYPEAPPLWRTERSAHSFIKPDVEQLIWSSYCDHLLANITPDAAVSVENEGLASRPLVSVLDQSLSTAKTVVLDEMNDGLRQALANPETALQRRLRQLMRFMSFALPAGTGVWAAFNVLRRYQQGLAGDEPFLGINFAVHSLLLIGLAWFIPFLLNRWLRPSLRDAARRGLRDGLDRAVDALSSGLNQACVSLQKDRQDQALALRKEYG